MTDYLVTDTELTSVADAIRTKGGTSADLSFPTGFVSAINDISTGGYSETDIKNFIERSSSFTNFTFPSGLTKIGNYAFNQCSYLAITSLPNTVTSIGDYSFSNCSNMALTSLPSGLTRIGSSAFQGCTLLSVSVLPSSVTYIGGSAFGFCGGLTALSCDGVIGTLGSGAFLSCKNLTSVSFPNLTASLMSTFGASSASTACTNLAFADMGNTGLLNTYAFANCNALETLVLRKTSAIVTCNTANVFNNTPMAGYNGKTGTVYVPSALISTYRTANNWKTLYDAGTLNFVAIEGSQYELS